MQYIYLCNNDQWWAWTNSMELRVECRSGTVQLCPLTPSRSPPPSRGEIMWKKYSSRCLALGIFYFYYNWLMPLALQLQLLRWCHHLLHLLLRSEAHRSSTVRLLMKLFHQVLSFVSIEEVLMIGKVLLDGGSSGDRWIDRGDDSTLKYYIFIYTIPHPQNNVH